MKENTHYFVNSPSQSRNSLTRMECELYDMVRRTVEHRVLSTEQLNEVGEYLRNTGHEFGTVTGRPRRCGWLDTAVVKYAAMLNSLDYLAITRLDILDDLDTIKICTGYKYQGQILKEYPASLDVLENVEPIYEEMPGWKADISKCKSYDELPEAARHYVERISELTGVPLGIVSVGPNRSQTIILKKIF